MTGRGVTASALRARRRRRSGDWPPLGERVRDLAAARWPRSGETGAAPAAPLGGAEHGFRVGERGRPLRRAPRRPSAAAGSGFRVGNPTRHGGRRRHDGRRRHGGTRRTACRASRGIARLGQVQAGHTRAARPVARPRSGATARRDSLAYSTPMAPMTCPVLGQHHSARSPRACGASGWVFGCCGHSGQVAGRPAAASSSTSHSWI